MTQAFDRDDRIRRAAMSSLVSKGSTFILQILAMPIAIRALGPEQYGIYAAVASIFTILNLSDFGVGPAVIRGIAEARATNRYGDARRLLGTAILTICTLVVVVAAGLSTIVALVPVSGLLGDGFEQFASEIRTAVWCGIGLIGVQIVAAVFLRAQAGCQELHVGNLFGAAGNAIGAIALVFLVSFHRVSVPGMVCAVIGGTVIASIANVGWFLVHHPELRPDFHGFGRSLVGGLLSDSGGFAVAAIVVPLIQRELSKLVIGRVSGPVEVGRFALLQQVATYISGIVFMYTGPLLPALTDSIGRRDFRWFSKARRHVFLLWAVVSIAGVCGSVYLGREALNLWVGRAFLFSRWELGLFFVYFSAMLWGHIHYVQLAAVGQVWAAARVQLIDVSVGLVVGIVLLPNYGLLGFVGGFVLVSASTSAWMLPFTLRRRLNSVMAEA